MQEPAEAVAPAAAVVAASLDPSLRGDISLELPLREARDAFERVYFEYHLARENHSMTRVSDKTGLERTHLYRKLKQLGIESRKRGG
jgi:DNA-binding NtrC family response regulator